MEDLLENGPSPIPAAATAAVGPPWPAMSPPRRWRRCAAQGHPASPEEQTSVVWQDTVLKLDHETFSFVLLFPTRRSIYFAIAWSRG